MITFTVENIFTHVDNPGPIAIGIGKFLNVRKDGYYQTIDKERYLLTKETVLQTKWRAEYINLYNHIRQTFPTGRLGYIADWCYENGQQVQIIDNRKKPEKNLDLKYIGPVSDGSNGKPARPYQIESTAKIQAKGGRGILWHATGSGKTCTGAHIMVDLGVNALYMVPSLELLNQTHENLSGMIDTKIGKIGEGVWDPKPITVATEQTLWARLDTQECKDFLNSRELMIFDECHHTAVAKDKKGKWSNVNSWYIISLNCPAYYRIGMTGTPGKDIESKRALLECSIGRVIDRVTVRQLIDSGVLCDVEVHMHNIKHKNGCSDYHQSRLVGVLTNEKLNEYIAGITISELKEGHNVLMLTGSKAHQGPMLAKIFETKYGMTVPFVSGDDTRTTRVHARKDFRDGKLKAIIGTIYREGVDFPRCDAGILCDGGRDEKATCQFMGRILRSAEGKKLAHLHDFNHKGDRFLKRHSQERLGEYVEQEIDKIVTHEGITV